MDKRIRDTIYNVVKEIVSSYNSDLDLVGLRELQLYIDNDSTIYRQLTSIYKNLIRKKKNGTYKHELAPKLFMYVVEAAAKKYTRDYSSKDTKWHELFPTNLRKALSEEMADDFDENYKTGEFAHLEK